MATSGDRNLAIDRGHFSVEFALYLRLSLHKPSHHEHWATSLDSISHHEPHHARRGPRCSAALVIAEVRTRRTTARRHERAPAGKSDH